ncbi:MAG: EAL domain-containing protein (putative c-di-GMP-specific phosphodiesterase class I) [Verrucomicrobiales bacterium]|jgi:EAL domain-containing protein (putative c-di-GMP-specific phosphodiesterase class I)/GGDEF domain-containing protein
MMAFRESDEQQARERRAPRRILRRLNIGPRLSLCIAVPTIALLSLVGLLATADAQSLVDLREFEAVAGELGDLVEIRTELQNERHLAALGSARASTTRLDDLLKSRDVEDRESLQTARALAANNRRSQSRVAYTELIDQFSAAIDTRLDAAPLGLAEQRSNALRSLLHSEEFFLLEDLEAQINTPDEIAMARLHTSATEALDGFSNHATPEAAGTLEALTISNSWRTLTLMRTEYFESGNDAFDTELWQTAAEVRRLSLQLLTQQETIALQDDVAATIDIEIRRLLMLLGIVGLVIAIAAFGAIRLRRSILAPLSNLTVNARLLSKGKLAPIEDSASDEIALVGNAFSSLASTMEHLWTDIDAVSSAVSDGVYDKRIDTEFLEGDWLRLAKTMNATLATGEAHRETVSEELGRRAVMNEISNAAVLAQSATELTSAVLRHLPEAVTGSHAHLHEHPSGPPEVDLGVTLEPSISALQIPTLADQAQRIELRDGSGVASLVGFPTGPPAVLVLRFHGSEPAQLEPLISLMETAGRILSQAHRRQAAESDAIHSRAHDLLTGLPNSENLREWFNAQADRSISWSALGFEPQRLDEWDGVFGRNARDLVLRAVAQTLVDTIATFSIEAGDDIALARVTEPEFVVLVPTALASDVTKAIVGAFNVPLDVSGAQINVDLTIGVDHSQRADRDLTQTVANLSAAIRQANGNTTEIVEFETRHREEVRRRAQLVSWLAGAIDNRDLFVHFQPIVNATTTAIEGYECLVRGSLDGQPLSPAEFIPVAEETNMIVAIGEFVLREACAAMPFLRGDSPYVAVNLSPIELSDPQLLERIDSIINESKVDRSRIVFEVTEGATTTAEGVQLLKRIRELGVKIAIDDFGSGQSNLSYLNTLPAQILKLDRSLVTPMVDDVGAASVVRKAIEMAHDLGMTVVGEGVETNEELDALRRVRCDRIQGWLTGRPAPLENFIEITIDRPRTRINMPRDSR